MFEVAARRAKRHRGQVAHDLQHFYPGQHRETVSSPQHGDGTYCTPTSRVVVCIFLTRTTEPQVDRPILSVFMSPCLGSPWETEQMFAREQRVSTDVTTSLVPPSRSQPPRERTTCVDMLPRANGCHSRACISINGDDVLRSVAYIGKCLRVPGVGPMFPSSVLAVCNFHSISYPFALPKCYWP